MLAFLAKLHGDIPHGIGVYRALGIGTGGREAEKGPEEGCFLERFHGCMQVAVQFAGAVVGTVPRLLFGRISEGLLLWNVARASRAQFWHLDGAHSSLECCGYEVGDLQASRNGGQRRRVFVAKLFGHLVIDSPKTARRLPFERAPTPQPFGHLPSPSHWAHAGGCAIHVAGD